MSKPSHDLFVDRIDSMIAKEIQELQELTELLSDSSTIVDADLKGDVGILTQKMGIYKNVRGMIKKASLGSDDFDSSVIMNLEERKLFMKIVKLIMRVRRFFKRGK
tara:strand:- start:2144 stop:2461 length:318 start_codon:yes stop_codon:yes gene_type:complete